MDEKSQGFFRFEAKMEIYDRITEHILAIAKEANISPKQQFKLELGIEEIATNIISYAYDVPGYLWVRAAEENGVFRLEFADHGKPFNPLAQEFAHGEVPTDDQEEGGYGIFLVKKIFPSLTYRYEEMFGGMANHLIIELPLT